MSLIPLPCPHLLQTERRLKELEAQAADAGREGDDAILQYKSLLTRLAELEVALKAVCMQPQHCLQFLRAGRVVAVRDGEVNDGSYSHFIIVFFYAVMPRGGVVDVF